MPSSADTESRFELGPRLAVDSFSFVSTPTPPDLSNSFPSFTHFFAANSFNTSSRQPEPKKEQTKLFRNRKEGNVKPRESATRRENSVHTFEADEPIDLPDVQSVVGPQELELP